MVKTVGKSTHWVKDVLDIRTSANVTYAATDKPWANNACDISLHKSYDGYYNKYGTITSAVARTFPKKNWEVTSRYSNTAGEAICDKDGYMLS